MYCECNATSMCGKNGRCRSSSDDLNPFHAADRGRSICTDGADETRLAELNNVEKHPSCICDEDNHIWDLGWALQYNGPYCITKVVLNRTNLIRIFHLFILHRLFVLRRRNFAPASTQMGRGSGARFIQKVSGPKDVKSYQFCLMKAARSAYQSRTACATSTPSSEHAR